MTRIAAAAILTGGKSQRMGCDKAQMLVAGRRLIDHVQDRLAGQIEVAFDTMVIAGPSPLGTGLPTLPDSADAPPGPLAGIWSVARWLAEQGKGAGWLLTVPVDAPLLPRDLASRLAMTGAPAIASDAHGWQPAFALWPVDALIGAITVMRQAQVPRWSLHALCEQIGAHRVHFDAPDAFLNINTPEDRVRAEALLAASMPH